jgi:tetratricopeptide (TPR) repeat protein
MLSTSHPADDGDQPGDRECLLEKCRFFSQEKSDCGLTLAHLAAARTEEATARVQEATARLQEASEQPGQSDLEATVREAGQAALDRVASLESKTDALGTALAQLGSEVAAIIEVQQKVAERLLEEMSLLEVNAQKLEGSVSGISRKLEQAEESHRSVMQAVSTQLEKDHADLAARRQDEAVASNNRGVTLYYRGAIEAARDAFKKALELHPEYPEALNNLGLALSKLGQEQEAIEAFRQALTFDPKMGEAYNNLGFLYHTNAQLDLAAQMFGQAVENTSDSSVAYTNLGNTLYAMQRHDQAVSAWRRAVDLDPLNENAQRALRMFQQDGPPN